MLGANDGPTLGYDDIDGFGLEIRTLGILDGEREVVGFAVGTGMDVGIVEGLVVVLLSVGEVLGEDEVLGWFVGKGELSLPRISS